MNEIGNEEPFGEARSASEPCVRAGDGHRASIGHARGYSIPTDSSPGVFTYVDAEVFVILEQLRNSGRMVGAITHVETMQAELPIGITVEKKSVGSTLKVGSAP